MSGGGSGPDPVGGDALLIDGRIVRIRPLRATDEPQLRRLYERISARSLYLRFFSPSRGALEADLGRLLRPPAADHENLVAELGGDLVAVAGYERLADPGVAEVAFLVDDAYHGLGLGSLLLEHLAAAARVGGIDRFVAETLAENAGMLHVFRDAGFEVRTSLQSGVVHVDFPTASSERSLATADAREAAAEFVSLSHLLAPRGVAVVGAGANPAGLGHRIVARLRTAGFAGPVYPVNRSGREVAGLPAWTRLVDVPGPVDLVVVAVPAEAVIEVARGAVARQARALVVTSAGFAEAGPAGMAREAELLAIARAGGMRLVGPNSLGVVNTDRAVRLDATVAPVAPLDGSVGVMSQSGAVGIATLTYAARAGIGVSAFLSVGNKADVSGNDVLCYFERDARTRVVALYLESFGNPRKFARIARRVARHKPVVAVAAGRSVAGARGARSHTAAAAGIPDLAVDALFAQAGVIRAESLAELLDTVALLDRAALPPGPRVAIVGNSGGAGILAADASSAAGLDVPDLTERTRVQLARSDATLTNPVDLGGEAGPGDYDRALTALLDDPEVDAVIAIYAPLHAVGLRAVGRVLAEAAGRSTKPVVGCLLGVDQPPETMRDPAGRPLVASYSFPEAAVRALAAVSRYAEWRRLPPGRIPELTGIDRAAARRLVEAALSEAALSEATVPEGSRGCWLPADRAVELLGCYGIPAVPTVRVADREAAAEAAGRVGWPVAVKAGRGDLVHKTDQGLVRLALRTPEEVRSAYDEIAALSVGGPVVVQQMAEPGVETAAGIVTDPAFGPLVVFGLGGVASDLIADRAFRLVPLSVEDAAGQVRALRASPLLTGYRGRPAADVAALEGVLLRLGRLAEDLPEVIGCDVNPLVVGTHGVQAVDVTVRLTGQVRPADPYLRRLRGASYRW